MGQFKHPRNPTQDYPASSLGKYLKTLGFGKREHRFIDGLTKNCIVWDAEHLKNVAKRYGFEIK